MSLPFHHIDTMARPIVRAMQPVDTAQLLVKTMQGDRANSPSKQHDCPSKHCRCDRQNTSPARHTITLSRISPYSSCQTWPSNLALYVVWVADLC